jgi:hypothetical protein
MVEVVDPGLDTFPAAHAYPKRLDEFGSMRTAPELPVYEVQPVHFTVNCQWVPLDLLPLVSGV